MRKIVLVLVAIFLLSLVAASFSSCGGEEKQIPIYQGMTITSLEEEAIKNLASNEKDASLLGAKEDFDYSKDNGNHKGHFKGDCTDDEDDEVDGENPYPDNDETIEDEINSSLVVEGATQDIYYANVNEDIYINIHISNPDNFEIMSFTLNGEKYSSYMFEDGSNMENIILKYNVGSKSGIAEYTIDAIKYIDGNDIKDVIIEGNKTVKAGIKDKDQIKADITNEATRWDKISFDVAISDKDKLIEYSNGSLKAVLYDGDNIVDVKDITVGENTVSFEGLKTNTLYQYAIVGYYDDFSGLGYGMNVLYKKALYTESIVLFDEITLDKEEISFSFKWNDEYSDKAIDAIKLYMDEKLVKEIDKNATKIEGLLSNSIYSLVAEYKNIDKTEVIELTFITACYTKPDFEIKNVSSTKDSIAFEITEDDTDSKGTISKIELVHENGTVEAESADVRAFKNLLSNNNYTVKVTYTYNLNDGNGDIEIVKATDIKTLEKTIPTVEVNIVTSTKDSVSFNITENDIDNIGVVAKIELVHKNGTTVAENANIREFKNLLSNNSYTVKVTYVYNLNDGNDDIAVEKTAEAVTLEKITPSFEIKDVLTTKDGITFNIAENDIDNIGVVTKIELVHKNGTTVAENANIREFKNLLSDNTYTVKVTYTYNLNDGNGDLNIVKTADIKTLSKTVPTFSITGIQKTQDGVKFGVSENDADNLGSVSKVELIHKNGSQVAENSSVREFTGLLSNNSYTIKITYTYNLNDGEGERTIVQTADFKTDAKNVPSVTFSSTAAGISDVSFGINEIDVDNIGELVKFELLLGEDVVSVITDTTKRKFEGLHSNTEYTVRITYKYNLCDGSDDVIITKTSSVKTGEANIPYILISGGSQTQTSIAFAIEESDTSNIGSITKIELYKGESLVKIASNNDVREFMGLLSNTEYTVRVTYVYNLNDGNGNHSEVREITIKTFSMAKPSIIFDETSSTKNSVLFTFDVVDINNISKFERTELIMNGDVISYTENADVNSFEALLSNTTYTVKVIYAYDLNDGTGVNYIEKSVEVKTYANAIPEMVAINPTKTQSSVGFEISEIDLDSVGAITKIELAHKYGIVVAESVDIREFTGLLSNNTYTVRITYTYNLNDGEGPKEIVKELEITTDAKATPDVTITNTNKTQSGFDFVIDVTDVDSVGSITKIELVHTSEATRILENQLVHNITGLLSNNTYTFVVTYTYDLMDGEGAKELIKSIDVKTFAKTVPSIIFDNVTAGKYDVSFGINEVDIDNIGEIVKIEILLGNNVVSATEDGNVRSFSDLLSNNEYTIKLTYKYNLCDESDDVIITRTVNVTTESNIVPSVVLSGGSQTQSSISYSVEESDVSNVGNIVKIELFKGDVFVKEAENNDVREFIDLLSDTEYTVRVTYSYNLNDGSGNHTDVKEIKIRTVSKATPVVGFDKIDKTNRSVSFIINVVDIDSVGLVEKVELLRNGQVVDSTVNGTSFCDLLSNVTYTVKLTYKYDLNDGSGPKRIVKTENVKTNPTQAPQVSISYVSKSQDIIAFTLSINDKDDAGYISKIELIHKDGITVADSTFDRSFTDLLSNNSYTIRVTYAYDLNDESGTKEIIVTKDATTLPKETPKVSIVNTTKTQDSIKFEIEEIDNDKVGKLTKLELVHGDESVELEDLKVRSFENLLSNNTYAIKATYVYDLNDGSGEHTLVKTATVTTLAKELPSFIVKNEEATIDSFTAEYDVVDKDEILAYHKITIYQGDNLICENADNIISFTDLQSYTEYNVRFIFGCDLNDGKGEQEFSFDYAFKTMPFIDVLECKIANTSAVSEGETIYMSVKLHNPLDMTVESVIINGEAYSVAEASTNSKIFVEIVYNEQFPGGDTYLKIDKVNARIDDITLTVEPQSELSDNVFINGKISVSSIQLVNENFEPLEHGSSVFPSEQVYVLVTFDNPTGYEIDDVGTKLDNNRYYYKKTSWLGWSKSNSISGFTYHNDYITKTIAIQTMHTSQSVYMVLSDEIKYVSTPNDLKNMSGKYYYQLTNDIDLSGIEWKGAPFIGVFDGNGYAIKNISFVGTIENTTARLGLFTTATGIVKDLDLEEATIIATIDSGSAGVLAGSTSETFMVNGCSVDEYSIIDVNGLAGGFVGSGYARFVNSTNAATVSGTSAGGFVGSASSGTFINSINLGKIIGEKTGGFLGSTTSSSGSVSFNDSINTGNIKGTSAGGFVGEASSGVTATNSINRGKIEGTNAGGFVGMATTDSKVEFKECENNGTVIGSNAGGMAGYIYIDEISTVVTVEKCSNGAEINGSSNAGGMVGKVYFREDNGITLKNCTNDGNINGAYAGGMIGELYVFMSDVTATYEICVNNGTIRGDYASGLIGRRHSYEYGISSYLQTCVNCVNNGDVYAEVSCSHPYEREGEFVNNGLVYISLKFETNGGYEIEPITSYEPIVLPTPTRDGYYFVGWYDNPEFEGFAIREKYYKTYALTLYAKWMSEEDYQASIDGLTVDNPLMITEEREYSIYIDDENISEAQYLKFTSYAGAKYKITITSDEVIPYFYATLYDPTYDEYYSPEEYEEGEGYYNAVQWVGYGEFICIYIEATSWYINDLPGIITITVEQVW